MCSGEEATRMQESGTSAGSVAIVNLGRIVTGDVDRPLADGDTILVADGHIAALGEHLAVPDGATVVDAHGQVAIPGLIDSHIHPSPGGDWTPRVSAHDWLAGYAQAGVTTATSQGSWHQGGYPDDAAGMVALSITLARAFAGFRPGGMKVHGATVSLVDGLGEADLELLRREGVWLVAEVGSRSIVDPERVRDLLAIAHRLGYVSRVHFGPEAVPGTHTVTAAMALGMGAQIASHVNGGPSPP